MKEILAIDPVPESREEKYQWIDRMVARGFKAKDACEAAGIPRGSYYMLHRRRPQDSPDPSRQEGAA